MSCAVLEGSSRSQHEGVLTKFVAEFGDLEVAHAPRILLRAIQRVHPVVGGSRYCMGPSTLSAYRTRASATSTELDSSFQT